MRSLGRNPEISFASLTEMSLQPDVNVIKGLTLITVLTPEVFQVIITKYFFFIYFADRASQYIYLNINQPDALNFMSLFHASTCFEHHVLIVRRSKLYYTASGIITPVRGRLVHSLREDSLNLCTGRPPTKCDDTTGCIVQFWPPDDEHIVLETCRGMK